MSRRGVLYACTGAVSDPHGRTLRPATPAVPPWRWIVRLVVPAIVGGACFVLLAWCLLGVD